MFGFFKKKKPEVPDRELSELFVSPTGMLCISMKNWNGEAVMTAVDVGDNMDTNTGTWEPVIVFVPTACSKLMSKRHGNNMLRRKGIILSGNPTRKDIVKLVWSMLDE